MAIGRNKCVKEMKRDAGIWKGNRMKVAVITGAAGGLGSGLAREAARRGMQVVLADRDEGALGAVARDIGNAAHAVVTDVTSPDAMEYLAATTWAAHGQVDFLFNNAGILSTGRSWEIDAATWQGSWAVNVDGVLNGLRAFVPRMVAAARPAAIVNTASVGGFLPAPFMAPYSATKFAVVALTESLAGELQALGAPISVSLLSPGPVKSGIWREPPADGAQGLHRLMSELIAEQGMSGDDVAPLIFDAVDRGDYWIFPHPEALEPFFSDRNRLVVEGRSPQFYLVDEDA